VREKIPNVAVTTDAIVGFCGETEDEFQSTFKAFEAIQFDQAFLFAYSPRHSTAAWEWPDDVAPETKSRRLNELIDLQREISRDKNRALIGETAEVLIEGVSDKDATRLSGRTRANKLMQFDGDLNASPAGSLVEVEAKEGFMWGFVGKAKQITSRPAASRVLIELQMA
jgi:tRNA-2-methylthio-N6-dimethylallyladenosine synthase